MELTTQVYLAGKPVQSSGTGVINKIEFVTGSREPKKKKPFCWSLRHGLRGKERVSKSRRERKRRNVGRRKEEGRKEKEEGDIEGSRKEERLIILYWIEK